jgi:peptidyl-tRNA hydrolase, PTH1 family
MKLIVGLGNPGIQYEQTRHNVGFRVVDRLVSQYRWKWERHERAMLASGTISTEKVTFVKPLTYMNNSGQAIGELLRWYKLQPDTLLIIYDEMDLAVGRVQLKPSGSAAGHNGIASIIQHVHTTTFPRLRIGIGKPTNHHQDTVSFVLGVPTGDERIFLANGESRAVDVLPLILEHSIDAAMNLINPDPEKQRQAEEKRQQKREQREQKRQLQAQEVAQPNTPSPQ